MGARVSHNMPKLLNNFINFPLRRPTAASRTVETCITHSLAEVLKSLYNPLNTRKILTRIKLCSLGHDSRV